jgi:CRISPR/Cas system-associated protein Cas5 (RAMP superfamily)
MLHKAISRGKRVGKAKTLEEIRENIKKELKTLPIAFKAIKKPVKYKVTVSKKLSKMVEGLRVKHIN